MGTSSAMNCWSVRTYDCVASCFRLCEMLQEHLAVASTSDRPHITGHRAYPADCYTQSSSAKASKGILFSGSPLLAEFVNLRLREVHERLYLIRGALEVLDGEGVHGYALDVQIQAYFQKLFLSYISLFLVLRKRRSTFDAPASASEILQRARETPPCVSRAHSACFRP